MLPAGTAGGGATAWPQLIQKRDPAASSPWQLVQRGACAGWSDEPHCMQNCAPAGAASPQDGQRCASSVVCTVFCVCSLVAAASSAWTSFLNSLMLLPRFLPASASLLVPKSITRTAS